MNQNAFPCPFCGCGDIRRSRTQGFGDVPRMLFGVYPFRCLGCGKRFFANIWRLSTHGFTRCPKCLRLDVEPWVKQEDRLSAWERLRMAWGAHSYRCGPCRHFFISFRPSQHGQPAEVDNQVN